MVRLDWIIIGWKIQEIGVGPRSGIIHSLSGGQRQRIGIAVIKVIGVGGGGGNDINRIVVLVWIINLQDFLTFQDWIWNRNSRQE